VRRFAEPRLLMTAAMAFFSISLTLSLCGIHLSNFRVANLRPTTVRSFMERRLTMASTPIIRYYDHLRFVYEVESRMRELRRTTENGGEGGGEGQGGETGDRPKQKETMPAAPGESKQNPGHREGGSRVDPPQQSVNPALNDYLESSLTFRGTARAIRRLHTGNTGTEIRERSTSWTA
jgi:hypothetical protein